MIALINEEYIALRKLKVLSDKVDKLKTETENGLKVGVQEIKDHRNEAKESWADAVKLRLEFSE